MISKNRQFEQMYPMNTDSYVAPLQGNWLSANLGLKSYCGFERETLYGQIIVERESATNLCTERVDPIDANHIDMVKPLDTTSTSHIEFLKAKLSSRAEKQRWLRKSYHQRKHIERKSQAALVEILDRGRQSLRKPNRRDGRLSVLTFA